MRTTAFRELFTLEVTHAYYDGFCPDVTFDVPADAAAVLRRGRLLAKVVDGRLHVLFEARETKLPIASLVGSVLRIGLRLTNSGFANVTALEFRPGSRIAVYRNGSGGALAAPKVAVPTGRSLVRALSRAERPVSVSLVGADGRGPAPVTVSSSADRPDVSFDLDGLAPGLFTLWEISPGGVTSSETYYLDPELTREPLLGVVEVSILDAFYAAPARLKIAFAARTETLRYYVVARGHSDADFAQISMAHAPATGPAAVTFTRVPPAEFAPDEIPAVALAAGDDKATLFRSDALVARRRGGLARIQLSRNGEVVLGNLPQAPPERPSADVIVHISKPKP